MAYTIAFFGTKPYDEASFNEKNKEFGFELRFFKGHLNRHNVLLTQGVDAVCIFVNDTADAGVIKTMAANGVKLLALRCAGYNNVDLAKAKECGIDVCVNTRNKNFGEAMVENFGLDKADVIYDCAGNNVTMGQAIQYARKGSTIILVAVFAGMAKIDLAVLNDHELDLNTSMMYRNEDYVEAIRLVNEGKVTLKPLISKHFAFQDYLKAYEYIDENRESTMKVIIDIQK